MTQQPSELEKKLREEASERIDSMPAETALGRRDPEGGGEGDPADYVSPVN